MIPLLPAVTPSDEVAVLLQAAGIGALFGTAIAARRRSRDPRSDTWLLTARWTLLAAFVCLLALAAHRLRLW